MPPSSRRLWAAPPPCLPPTLLSGSQPGSWLPHRDQRLPLVLLFQGAQLRWGQQSQSQLPHHRGRYLGHRPLQHRLQTPALSPSERGRLARRPFDGFLRPKPPSAPPPHAPLSLAHRAHARPAPGCQDEFSLVYAELVTAQQRQQRGRRQLQEAPGPKHFLWVREWVREERNEVCGLGSMKMGCCTWLWASMKAMQRSCSGPRPKVTATWEQNEGDQVGNWRGHWGLHAGVQQHPPAGPHKPTPRPKPSPQTPGITGNRNEYGLC